MKVLIVSLPVKGGMVSYSHNVINSLDFDADIILSKYCEPKICTKAHKEVPIKLGIKNYLIFLVTYFPYLFVKTFIDLLRNKYQAVYILGPLWIDLMYVILFRLFRKKVFYTIHEGVSRLGVRRYPDIEFCIKHATHLIFLSQFQQKKVYEKLNLKDKPFKVVYHSDFDKSYFLKEGTELSPKPTLALLGNISEYKGIYLLLDSINFINKNLFDKIIIAGKFLVPIPDSIDANKVEIIDKWLSEEEMIEIITKSDLLLLPYLEASQSGIAARSICFLKPTIITPVGALPEQFNYSASYITPDLTPQGLAYTIEEACSNRVKHLQIIEELKQIQKRISWEYSANEIKNFIFES